jgi:phosphoglycolate phosphatase
VTVISPPVDAAIFDFDGVIIDSRAPVRAAVRSALESHRLPVPADAVLDAFIGPPTVSAFAEVTGEAEDAALVLALTDAYHDHYNRVYLTETALIDGVDEVLRALAPPLALATSKQAEFAVPLLERLGIRECFAVVAAPTLADLEERKAVTLGRAIAELRCHRPVMVGDRHFDIDAARANAIRSIGVTWGIGDRAELAAAGADVIIDRPPELLDLLGRAGS